jgi:hypothetical protein
MAGIIKGVHLSAIGWECAKKPYPATQLKCGAGFTAGQTITVAAPLTMVHAAGAQVSGTGITLNAALTRAHANGAQVAGSVLTPGAPNQYYRKGVSTKK